MALVVSDHEHHGSTWRALDGTRLGLCGHAAFETFSVLTRLPPPARRSPSAVARLLSATFPYSRFLGASQAQDMIGRLATYGIAGGSVYDALVAATAAEHDLALATRDRRAIETYRMLDARIELLP